MIKDDIFEVFKEDREKLKDIQDILQCLLDIASHQDTYIRFADYYSFSKFMVDLEDEVSRTFRSHKDKT